MCKNLRLRHLGHLDTYYGLSKEFFMSPIITYIVEDSATIRENLIATLEEIACFFALGVIR